VGGLDDAAAHRQGSAAYCLRVERLERHATPDHVDDGVHGPDLVEGHVLRVPLVDRSLGHGEAPEGLEGA
jgi:hypothetical protein